MLKKFDLPFGKLVRLSLPSSQSMCIWLYYCMICVALSSDLCWSGFSRDACHSLCPVMSWMKLLLGWCVLLPVYFVFMVILISSPWVYDIELSSPPTKKNKQTNNRALRGSLTSPFCFFAWSATYFFLRFQVAWTWGLEIHLSHMWIVCLSQVANQP